jgi:hypothetical protein
MSSKFFISGSIIASLLFILSFSGPVQSETMNPVLEQQFLDARTAILAAQSAQADKYAPDKLKEARECMTRADRARLAKDETEFSQATRMARAFAELATVSSELEIKREKQAAVKMELQKIKAEIQGLEKDK